MNNTKKYEQILANLKIASLNEMQIEAKDIILREKNTILISPTGSGKTLAFLLPIVELLNPKIKAVQCLIIVPARELALQIESVWKKMDTGFKVNVCYGGHSMETEFNNLSTPPAVLIGTPGRLNDHLNHNSFVTNNILTLVLDEFDKSLELGFQEEMGRIIALLSKLNRRVLTSATIELEVPKFARVSSPTILDYTKKSYESSKLSLRIITSPDKDKIESLFNLLCTLNSEPALVFCNHREVTERISALLSKKGISAGFYHGGMDQDDRERVLVQFRNKSLGYLITTDLAARGLDIPAMKHVIHYHLPNKENEFIHRNGRTARMNDEGNAYIIQHASDEDFGYIPKNLPIFNLPTGLLVPTLPEFQTLYISGGKKNKLSKGDIVGFFVQKGKLNNDDIGLIEVKDFISYVAVRTSCIKVLLTNIKNEKMKGKKYKIEITKMSAKRNKD